MVRELLEVAPVASGLVVASAIFELVVVSAVSELVLASTVTELAVALHNNDGHDGRLEQARDDEGLLESLDHNHIHSVAPDENMVAWPV